MCIESCTHLLEERICLEAFLWVWEDDSARLSYSYMHSWTFITIPRNHTPKLKNFESAKRLIAKDMGDLSYASRETKHNWTSTCNASYLELHVGKRWPMTVCWCRGPLVEGEMNLSRFLWWISSTWTFDLMQLQWKLCSSSSKVLFRLNSTSNIPFQQVTMVDTRAPLLLGTAIASTTLTLVIVSGRIFYRWSKRCLITSDYMIILAMVSLETPLYFES